MRSRPPGRRLLAASALALVLAGCAGGSGEPQAGPTSTGTTSGTPTSSPTPSDPRSESTDDPGAGPGPGSPRLRAGEWFEDLALPASYTPSAPYGTGTDDYRCFLLDPGATADEWITGVDVLPGNPEVVHHVILFRVPPDQVTEAETTDASQDGPGWTCFSGTGLGGGVGSLDRAPWLGAWAPGGSERVMAPDVGVPLEAGSRIIMQVHYNLLAGPGRDRTAARLRMAPGTKPLTPLNTMLLPAPVELPCRPGVQGRLCDRNAAVANVVKRFGADAGSVANGLHLLCGAKLPGPTQSCERTVREPVTVRGAAGHMHLLGTRIEIVANQGTPRERTLLRIRGWDFDDQGSRSIRPERLAAGDTVTVTCTHSQDLRDRLPAFRGQPERYVVWGEGTTDEMCLGILLTTDGA